MEDPKNTTEVKPDTKAASSRPTAPKDAVVKKADPVAEATAGLVSTESVTAAAQRGKSVIDRPSAPKDAKKAPANKAPAKKAAPAKAPAAKAKADRPMVKTGQCACCGREEVLEPFEVVAGVSLDICIVCKTDVLAKADAIKAKVA